MIIDSHCHLDDDKFQDDLQAVLERAKCAGVDKIVIPGADINSLERARNISRSVDNVYFAAGVHPYDLDGLNLDILSEFADDKKCVAIGECGLDFYRDKDDMTKQKQKDAFYDQISLAKQKDLPLIIHARDANEMTYQILLENAGKIRAVLHCFNASPLLLELAQKGDFYYGIGGVLTFKNAKNLVEILSSIPKNRILIETDAPYLAPTPHRGERNEPAFTALVAEKIAQILNITREEVENFTTQNAREFFKF